MVLFHGTGGRISRGFHRSRAEGMGEAFILEGEAAAAVFELYVEQILAPSLPTGHSVILDTLNTHLGAKVRHAI
jgi:transposase